VLPSYLGFAGGLKSGKSNGETSPYHATASSEIMLHVATRMPSSSDEDLLAKTRHIGNDEVHVVWSEHSREYRRGVLPTEFCDVLLAVYPLKGSGKGLCRVTVDRKPEVPFFGPLFNEAVVDQRVLPGLIRATAVNASRAKRSMLTYYQQHYEERHRSLEAVTSKHAERSSFEDYASAIFKPNSSDSSSSAAGSGNRPLSLVASTSLGANQLASAYQRSNAAPSTHIQATATSQHSFSSSTNELLLRPPKGTVSESPHHAFLASSQHFLCLQAATSPTPPSPLRSSAEETSPRSSKSRPPSIREEEPVQRGGEAAIPPPPPPRRR